MSTIAIILVLVSSFLHASWNFLGKRHRPSASSFTVFTTLGSLCISPSLILLWDGLDYFTAEMTLLLMASCFFQALYFYSLGQGYQRGDMSVIYPVSRSLPVLMVALGATLFGQGAVLQGSDWVAFLIIILGCLLLPLDRLSFESTRRYFNASSFFALLAAVGTTGYSILDDRTLRLFRHAWDTPDISYKAALLYLILQTIGTAAFLMMASLPFQQQRREMVYMLRNRFWPMLLTGLVMYITYGIVLTAMGFSDNVSYVVALRQASIPIGVIMGVFLLKETASLSKWLGTGLLVTGLIWISLT